MKIHSWHAGQIGIVWFAALCLWFFVLFMAEAQNVDTSLALVLLFLVIPAVPLALTWRWFSGPSVPSDVDAPWRRPFVRALVCGAVLYAVLGTILMALGTRDVAYALGRQLASVSIASSLAGPIVRASGKPSSWGWIATTVVTLYLVLVLVVLR